MSLPRRYTAVGLEKRRRRRETTYRRFSSCVPTYNAIRPSGPTDVSNESDQREPKGKTHTMATSGTLGSYRERVSPTRTIVNRMVYRWVLNPRPGAQWWKVIIEDETNNVLSGGNGILVANDLSTHADGGLESLHRLGFTCIIGPVNFPPRVIDEHDIPKGAFATKISEHPPKPRQFRSHPVVGGPVEVEETDARAAPFVSVYGRRE